MSDEQLPHFARRLREIREQAGLTQYALGQRSGVAKQAINRMEQGTSNPGWTTVQRLALALGVDCTEFLDPTISLPEKPTGRPVGRPRKDQPAEVAPPPPAAPADASPAEAGQERKAPRKKRGK